MLTAADVEQKTFSTALRGYDLDEVDDFLDEIVATIRHLNDQIEEAQKGASERPSTPVPTVVPEPESVSEPEPESPPPPPPVIDESAVGRALIAAQTAADQLLADAQGEASKILDEAKSEADSWEAEEAARKFEAETRIAALAARVSSVRSELSVLAGEVSEKLDDMDDVIAGRHSPVESAADEGGVDVGEGAVLDFDDDLESGDDGVGDESTLETGTANGADHLDDILTGVAADLQFGSNENVDSEDEDASNVVSGEEDASNVDSGEEDASNVDSDEEDSPNLDPEEEDSEDEE